MAATNPVPKTGTTTLGIPDIGAIIPSTRGRKIAYAVFALASFTVGNALVFSAAVYDTVPAWLIGLSAIVTNSAPAFSAIAIANAKSPE